MFRTTVWDTDAAETVPLLLDTEFGVVTAAETFALPSMLTDPETSPLKVRVRAVSHLEEVEALIE